MPGGFADLPKFSILLARLALCSLLVAGFPSQRFPTLAERLNRKDPLHRHSLAPYRSVLLVATQPRDPYEPSLPESTRCPRPTP